MVFKEKDRDILRETYRHAAYTKELVKDLSALRNGDHDEVTVKLDSIEHGIEALSAKIDALTQNGISTEATLYDIKGAVKGLCDLIKAVDETQEQRYRNLVDRYESLSTAVQAILGALSKPLSGELKFPADTVAITNIPKLYRRYGRRSANNRRLHR